MSQNIIARNNVKVTGTGTEPMLFAHGFGCDQHMWRFVTPAFENDYRLVLFDYVGSGKSDLHAYNPERYSTLNGYAEDLLDICEALQLRDVTFVGHSVSCMTGLLAAIRENYIGWANFLAPVVMKNPDRPELATELTESFCSTDPTIARRFAQVTFFSDNRQDVSKVTVPTLILQCSEDLLAPKEVGVFLHQNMPHSTLRFMKATGHCPHLSAPEETITLIQDYLSQQKQR
jgi:sigma-B regulation protein RsbQ